MDWKKANERSGPGTFILTALMLVFMVAQARLPSVSESPESNPNKKDIRVAQSDKLREHVNSDMIQWLPPFLVGLCVLAAALIHLKAASITREVARSPSNTPKSASILPVPAMARAAAVSAIPTNAISPQNLTQQAASPMSARVLTESGEQTTIPVTPEALIELYSKHTTLIADQLASNYLGKWLKVSGKVSDVSKNSVSLKGPLILYFADRWKDAASVLTVDTTIEVIGQIDRIGRYVVSLKKCEFSTR